MAPLIKVLILAGQSAAVGQSPSVDLAALAQEHPGDYGKLWDPLTNQAAKLNQVFVRVGPDFGENPHEGLLSEKKDNNEELLVLLKTAAMGSLSNEWRPPLSKGETGIYYKAMMKEIALTMQKMTANVHAASEGEGKVDVIGFVWMVGYEDVHQLNAPTSEYELHFSNLIKNVREGLHHQGIPILVMGLDSFNQTTLLSNAKVMRDLEQRTIQSMDHVTYTVMDPPVEPSKSPALRTLEIGRHIMQSLSLSKDKQVQTAEKRELTMSEFSHSMLMTFELDPKQVQAGENCDDVIATLIRNSYNDRVADASCQSVASVSLNEDLISYASLSGDGFIAADSIVANVRFDVLATGTLQATLFSDECLSATDFVQQFNANLDLNTLLTCPGAIVEAMSAVDLIQDDTCSQELGNADQDFRLSFRLKDTTGTISQAQLEELTDAFNRLGVATYNELNALNPSLCDPLHQEASFVSSSARRQEQDSSPLLDRPLERSMRKRLDHSPSVGETRQLVKDSKQIKSSSSAQATAIKSDKNSAPVSKAPSTKSQKTGAFLKSTKGPTHASTKDSKMTGIMDEKSTKGPSDISGKSVKSARETPSSKSTKSIKSGETPPSGLPSVPGAASAASSFSTSCVGTDCGVEDIFSEDSTSSAGRRRLTDVDANECLCPDGTVEPRAPTQEEFQTLFEDTFISMQASGAFPELACVRPGFVFSATVVTELEVAAGSEPSEDDIMAFGQEYQNQYNQLNLVDFCDPFSRSIDSFSFTSAEITPEARRKDRDLQFGFFSSFLVYYTYRGSCTNCRQEQGLYDDTSAGRKLQGTTLSPSSTCLCSDPNSEALTEETFTTETNDVFVQLVETLPSVQTSQVVTGLSAFECPTGVAPRFTNNFFEMQGFFFGLDILDVRVELNEFAAPCAGTFPITGVRAHLLVSTSGGLSLGTVVPTILQPIGTQADMANFVVRFQMNFAGLGLTGRRRVGFVLETSAGCGNVLGPNQVSLTPDSDTIICLPEGSQDIIVPPPLTATPTPAPFTAPPTITQGPTSTSMPSG